MDEAPAMLHLAYGKDELRSSEDVVKKDLSKSLANVRTDLFEQYDKLSDSQMESMNRSGELLMRSEGKMFVNDSTPEEFMVSKNQHWKSYDENSFSEELAEDDDFQNTHSLIQKIRLNDIEVEEIHDSNETTQDEFALEGEKYQTEARKQNKNDFSTYDEDKFKSNFADNIDTVFSCATGIELRAGDSVDYSDDGDDSNLNDILNQSIVAPPPRTTVPNMDKDEHDYFTRQSNGLEELSLKDEISRSKTIGYREDISGNNLENVSPKEKAPECPARKQDDSRKIFSKLEAFNKNSQISSCSVKLQQSKIEDNEMPTKGVVSNLKLLFENNAVHNNNDTYKSSNYKLEYGVGRSSGTLDKGIFQ